MTHRTLFFVFLLGVIPEVTLGQERQGSTLSTPVSLLPSLLLPKTLGLFIGDPPPGAEYGQYRAKRAQWRIISAGTLLLGTSTLVAGVVLFNRGDNAKKNAAGDALINVGFGVDLAALLPLGVAYYWGYRLRN